MPQFNPGEEGVAIATFPTKPAGLPCTAELWLASDMTKVAMSGEIPFTATGRDKSVTLPITLPSVEGTYPVYLEVFSNGERIAVFRSDEDVVITAPVSPPFTISGSGVGIVCPLMTFFWYPDLTFTVVNPNSVQVTHTLQLWKRYLSLGTGGIEYPNAVTLVGTLIPPGEGSPISITLPPGGSYSYRITGWAVHPDIPGMVMYQLTLAKPRSYFYWLQDELGNMSPEVNIVRS